MNINIHAQVVNNTNMDIRKIYLDACRNVDEDERRVVLKNIETFRKYNSKLIGEMKKEVERKITYKYAERHLSLDVFKYFKIYIWKLYIDDEELREVLGYKSLWNDMLSSEHYIMIRDELMRDLKNIFDGEIKIDGFVIYIYPEFVLDGQRQKTFG